MSKASKSNQASELEEANKAVHRLTHDITDYRAALDVAAAELLKVREAGHKVLIERDALKASHTEVNLENKKLSHELASSTAVISLLRTRLMDAERAIRLAKSINTYMPDFLKTIDAQKDDAVLNQDFDKAAFLQDVHMKLATWK